MCAKKRSFEVKSIEEILSKITQQQKISAGLQQVKIKQLWGVIMGPNVAQYTEEIEFRNSTLYVKLNSSTLREELSYGKEKILNHLNESLGSSIIQKIILR
jgi:predicted nucleic acid-binding Zn ribbon protein